MPRVHFVKKARKADPRYDINVGDSYYHWSFRYGGMQKSKTPPKRSQLTQSSFLSQLYDLQDQGIDREDLESSRDDLVSSLEDLKSECEESLENIPEQLRDAPAGETLQERIDSLESWISDLEYVDLEIDEDELKAEVADELGVDEFDEKNAEHMESFEAKLDEKKDELATELEGCDQHF